MYINCIMCCMSHELQIYNVDTDIEMDNNLKFSVHSTAHCYYFSKFDMLPIGTGQCFMTWNSLGHSEFAACLLHYYQYETYLFSAV
jgi:hypothetical protein